MLFYQIKAVWKPETAEHRTMNLVYIFLTAVQFILIGFAFKKKTCSGTLTFIAYLILIPRMSIRLLDFEGTKDFMLPTDF
jgi:hypothetical protein